MATLYQTCDSLGNVKTFATEGEANKVRNAWLDARSVINRYDVRIACDIRAWVRPVEVSDCEYSLYV